MADSFKSKYLNKDEAQQYITDCKAFFRDSQLDLIEKPRPAANRQCTDVLCLILFIIIISSFLVYSSYSINFIFQQQLTTLNTNDSKTFLKQVSQTEFEELGVVVGACIGGSVIIGIILLLALKFIPRATIYFMAFATSAVIFAFGIIEMATITDQGSFFVVVAMCYVGLVIGFCSNLEQAAILMKTVGHFITENLKILLVLFFAIFYCGILLFLWVAGMYSFCIRYSHGYLTFEGFAVSFAFWIFMLFFFNFYFYYTSVFITSNAIAIWFYDKTDQFDIISTPFKLMTRYHLGTITLASLVITFVKFIKFLFVVARFKQSDCPIPYLIGSFAYCFIRCCCGIIEPMIQVMNSYSVILCSLTGRNLIDASKLVGQFVFNDKNEIFSNFTMTTYLVNIGGVLTISIIPTFVGGIITMHIDGPLWVFSVMIIFFTTSMLGLLMLQIFVESASTLFLLYRLDGKLSEQGLNVVWIDKFAKEIQKSFDQAFVGKLQKPKIKTRTITTVIVHGNGVVQAYKENFQQLDHDRTLSNLHEPHNFRQNPNILNS